MRLNDITQGVSTDTKKKRSNDTSPQGIPMLRGWGAKEVEKE